MSTNTILASAPLTSTGYHLKANGTTLGNSLIWDNGTNVGIGNTNTSYTLDVSGTGRFTGNVGVGSGTLNTYTGYSVLTINNSTTGSVLDLNRSGVRTGTFYADTSGVGFGALTATNLDIFTGNSYINFQTNGAERMRITSAGDVGIGATPTSFGSSYTVLDVYNATVGGYILARSPNVTGQISVDNNTAMYVQTRTNHPILFATNNAVRMRITTGGGLVINDTSQANGGYYLQIGGTNGGCLADARGSGDANYYSTSTTIGYHIYGDEGAGPKFYVLRGGQIYSTSTSITLISSDYNLKTDIKDYDKGLAEVLLMKPRYYKYKDNLEEEKIGFIAQEMEQALVGSMIDVPSSLNSEETHKTYQVEWYPLLVKAIQEMNTKLDEQNQTIQNLQAQNQDLKSRLDKAGL